MAKSYPISQISPKTHQDVTINRGAGFPHAASLQITPIMGAELDQIAMSYPILMLRDGTSGTFSMAAMLGLFEGENLFTFVENGIVHWNAPYVPALVNRYPFALGQLDPQGERLALCLTHDDRYVGGEGERLYDENGKETPFLQQIKQGMSLLAEDSRRTIHLARIMGDHGLVREIRLKFDFSSGRIHTIDGIYVPDKEKIAALSDEDIVKHYKAGILDILRLMTASSAQINRLVQIYNSRKDDKIIAAVPTEPNSAL